MKNAKDLKELVFAFEPLAYYFGLKPSEFWNSRYREITMYLQMQLIKMEEDFKQEIILQEAVSNKMLKGNPLNKKAKVIPLTKTFSKLFDKKK